jgi:hypothetical protein
MPIRPACRRSCRTSPEKNLSPSPGAALSSRRRSRVRDAKPVAPDCVGGVWRPRPCLASTAPGGAGAPPGTTKSPCREPADAMRSIGRMEAKRGPAPQGKRHDGAPGGARMFARTCGSLKDRCAARCSVPPLRVRRGETSVQAHPAPQTTGVMTHIHMPSRNATPSTSSCAGIAVEDGVVDAL